MLKQSTERAKYYQSIHVMRFIAALMVVSLHGTFYTHERLDSSIDLYDLGGNGVRLFFVISGFVMVSSSLKMLNRENGHKIFLMHRLIRIVPIYWLTTSLKLAVLFLAPAAIFHAQFDITYILKSYAFIPAYNVEHELRPLLGVGWSLNYEMFFYILFFLALLVRVNPILFCAPPLVLLAISGPYLPSTNALVRFYGNAILLDFLWGMLAATLIERGLVLGKRLAMVAIPVTLILLFAPLGSLTVAMGTYPILTGLVAFLAIFACASLDSQIDIRYPKVAIYLGSASYSVYLAHPLVSPAVPTLLSKMHLSWPYTSVGLCVLVGFAGGALLHTIVERPITSWLNHKFVPRPQAGATPVGATAPPPAKTTI